MSDPAENPRAAPPGGTGRHRLRLRRWWVAAALAGAVVFVGALPSLPPGVRNWDNQVKLQVTRNILQGKGPVLTEKTPADDYYVHLGKDGQSYTSYLPVAFLLQVPTLAMAALGVVAEGISALVLLAIMAAALVGWGRSAGVTIPAAMTGALLVCVATPLWPMTAHGYDNLVDALGLLAILWAGTGPRKESAWAVAGLVVGAALAARLSTVLLVVPAAVLLLAQGPRTTRSVAGSALGFAAGCLPGVLLILWFNAYRFGSPFVVHTVTRQGAMDQLVEPWFSPPDWVGMAGLTVSFGKGLFWYAPVLLGVLVLARPLLRRFGAAMVGLGAYAVVAVVFFGRLKFWHGDWTWGPRYLAPLCIAAAPLGWIAWEKLLASGRPARVAAAVAVSMLVLIQVVPVVSYPIESYFAFTLSPLSAEGRLVTRPITAPPLPADTHLLYFRLENAPIVRLAENFPALLANPMAGPRVRAKLAWTALLPALALASLLLAARGQGGSGPAGPGAARGPGDDPPP